MSLVDMIRASFGDPIATKASELLDGGKGQQLSFLQLVQEAERSLWESRFGSFQEFEQLRTNSHLVEEVEEDQE